MRLLGWALIRWDQCPYKKGRLNRDTENKDRVKTQGKWPSISQGERIQKKTNPAHTLTADF